jgi:predicted nucleic acid-binding protein
MNPHVLDTSTINHYLDARLAAPMLRSRVDQAIRGDGGAWISWVTLYEIRRGLKYLTLKGQSPSVVARADLFLRSARILPGLDESQGLGWEAAANLHAQAKSEGRAISEADHLIMTTAVMNNRLLLTTDGPLADYAIALGLKNFVERIDLA